MQDLNLPESAGDTVDVTRPRLMPRKSWSRPPNEEEADIIPRWEEKYIQARTKFERYDARAKDSHNQNPAPISPEVYLKWLRQSTRQYNEGIATYDPKILKRMRVTKATLAGLGHIDHPPRHGEAALTVDAYWKRVIGDARAFEPSGPRLHIHHTPKYESVAGEISYGDAITVAIGEGVHQELHFVRDPKRRYETRQQQVDGDFDFIAPQMEARGYAQRQIKRAREKAHDLNNDLGLYRRGK